MGEVETELLLRMYETAFTIRRFEQRAVEQYRLGNIRGYLHLYLGEEAIAVGAIAALQPDDYIVSTHRGHGHAMAKGHEPRRMMAELFGKETGYCRGRGGSMHVAAGPFGTSARTASSGAGSPIAAGAALAESTYRARRRRRSSSAIVASAKGIFHEAMNLAAILGLPVVWSVLRTTSTPCRRPLPTVPGSRTFPSAPPRTACPE